MKNKIKLLQNISIITIIGFMFISCQTNQESSQLSQNLMTCKKYGQNFLMKEIWM